MNIKHAEQLNVLQAEVKCLNEKVYRSCVCVCSIKILSFLKPVTCYKNAVHFV